MKASYVPFMILYTCENVLFSTKMYYFYCVLIYFFSISQSVISRSPRKSVSGAR